MHAVLYIKLEHELLCVCMLAYYTYIVTIVLYAWCFSRLHAVH